VPAPMPVARPAADVVDAFAAELDEIESIFASCRGARSVTGFDIPYMPVEDGCLVSLWDAWNRFLRSLTLNACSGSTLSLSGSTYAPVVARTEVEAIAHLVANKKGKAYNLIEGEPKWFNPAHLSDVMSTLEVDAALQTSVISAIGATSVALGPVVIANPLEEVRVCRNFIAHKARATLAGVQHFAQGPLISLSDHLRDLQAGVETFSVWRESMTAIAETAAQ